MISKRFCEVKHEVLETVITNQSIGMTAKPSRRRPGFGHCADGQQLKRLPVTNDLTKEGRVIDMDGRIRSPRVIEVLSPLVSARAASCFLRSDNGPEGLKRTFVLTAR